MPKHIIQGSILIDKQKEIILVKVKRRFTHPLLKKSVRRSKNYHVHDDASVYKVGDVVSIKKMGPISKLKRWVIVRTDRKVKISNPSSTSHHALGNMKAQHRRATGSATTTDSAQISDLKNSFNKLLTIEEMDLRTVELVISRLSQVEMGEAGKSIQELLAEDNRRSRDRFIAELAPLRRDDVLRLAQQIGPDGEATLRRWEAERLVFSITHHGKIYYPEFQFKDRLPRPIVKAVLDALPHELSDWQRAFWFVSANGWVHDEAPVAHLDDPDVVLQAARYEGEPVIG